MIDIDALRAANKARLLGETAVAANGVKKITKEEVANEPQVCWKIIELATKRATTTMVDKTGKERKVVAKGQMYPIMPEEIVGITVGGKGAKTNRTNIETMRKMVEVRKAMTTNAINDVNDSYIEYFKSVVEVLDAYATTVVADMLDADPDVLDKVYDAMVKEAE